MEKFRITVTQTVDRVYEVEAEQKAREETKKYKEGYEILSEYFDSISDEEKPKVDKQLTRIGL